VKRCAVYVVFWSALPAAQFRTQQRDSEET